MPKRRALYRATRPPNARLSSRSAENISRTGVLFHADGTINVMVEIEEGGMIKKVPGRLIRTERLGDAEQGWAVEFDAA